MPKPKVAFYWCASCGGCEEAVVDLAEDILGVVNAVDIVFWPVALDFKRIDVESFQDDELTASFINGAIRNSEQDEMAKLLRKKSKYIIAFGSCSHMGGLPGLANLYTRKDILNRVYFDAPSMDNPERTLPLAKCVRPEGVLTLPDFDNAVRTLDQTISVDYYLPGCPPPVPLIINAVNTLLEGSLPPRGTVLTADKALCSECPRNATKPEKLSIKELRRPHEIIIDSDSCLLTQGVLCLGPVTRSGCDAACLSANMPCTGCLGPTSHVKDYGAKAISAIASLLDSNDAAEIDALADQIVDPAGVFYRYSLPASLLHGRVGKAPAQK
jgi:F420-non-reducing hydrogenase small subunit